MDKNILNSIFISLYVTVQDMAFLAASIYYNISLASAIPIIILVAAILFTIIFIAFLISMFYFINYNYSNSK